MEKKKIAFFIDGAYLDKVLEFNFDMARIDYGKFVDNLVKEDEEVVVVYYYHCLPYSPPNPDEEDENRVSRKRKFFGALSGLSRFNVRLGHLVFRGTAKETLRPIYIQKRIDGMLTADMVLSCTDPDYPVHSAYLIAGDSDFIPAVQALYGAFEVPTVLVHGASLNEENNMIHNSLARAVSGTVQISEEVIKQSLR